MKREKVSIEEIEKVIPFYADERLTPNELIFLYHFCNNDFMPLEAYQATFGGARSRANRIKAEALLKKQTIRRVIQRYLAERLGLQKDKLKAELFDLYYTQATFLPSDIINEEGELKTSLEKMPRNLQRCIESIITKKTPSGIKNVTIKLVDRSIAMDKLQQWVGFVQNDINVKHSIGDGVAEKLAGMFESLRNEIDK